MGFLATSFSSRIQSAEREVGVGWCVPVLFCGTSCLIIHTYEVPVCTSTYHTSQLDYHLVSVHPFVR